MSILISIGKWGGIYVYKGWSFRVCLGFFAITFFPADLDGILESLRKP